MTVTRQAPNGSDVSVSRFITFEGPEGSGKTTQIRLLDEFLSGRGYEVLTTREPGGTRIGNAIRSLLLDPANKEMSPRAEALLFNAARAQIVDEVIAPALRAGKIVLCDRYGDSTLAYQGFAHGQDVATLRGLIRFATAGLSPYITIYLDIDAETGLRRKQADEWNRMEAHALAFHQAVRQGYLTLASQEPERWLVIDASMTIDQIREGICNRVLQALRQKEVRA